MIEFCVCVILLYNQIRVHIGRAIFFLNTQVISYNWNIVESGIKHHQTNKQKPTQAISYFFKWLIKPFYMHILRRNVLWHCIVLPLNNFTRLLQMVVWGSVNFLAIFHFCHSTGIFMKLYSMKSSVLYTCHALTSTILFTADSSKLYKIIKNDGLRVCVLFVDFSLLSFYIYWTLSHEK